jgi:hypothetical protein
MTYASKDAVDIADALARAPGRFREARKLVLTDKKARRVDILAAKDFLKSSKPDDEVIVFVSGHGVIDENGEYYFCPADFQSQGGKNGLSYNDLEGLFDGIPAMNRLLLVDSCHSGELTDDQKHEIVARYSARLGAKGVRVRAMYSNLTLPLGTTAPHSVSRTAADVFLDLRRTTGATVLSAAGGSNSLWRARRRRTDSSLMLSLTPSIMRKEVPLVRAVCLRRRDWCVV